MALTAHCDIVMQHAEQENFSGPVEMLIATGSPGDLGVTPGHTPLFTLQPVKHLHITSTHKAELGMAIFPDRPDSVSHPMTRVWGDFEPCRRLH